MIISAAVPNLNQGIGIAESISNYGFIIVVAAFFILLSVVQQWLNSRRYEKLMDQNDRRYQVLFEKFTNEGGQKELVTELKTFVNTLKDLVTPIQELVMVTRDTAREECTASQVARIIESEAKALRFSLLDQTALVVEVNNIHKNEKKTKSKIASQIKTTFSKFIKALTIYKYKGMEVSYALNLEKEEDMITELVTTFVYEDPSHDYRKLVNDLKAVVDGIQIKIMDGLGISV